MKILKTPGTARISLRSGHVRLKIAGAMLITTGNRHALAARLIFVRTGVGTGSPLQSPQVSLTGEAPTGVAPFVELEGEIELEVKSGLGRLTS